MPDVKAILLVALDHAFPNNDASLGTSADSYCGYRGRLPKLPVR